MSRSHLIPDLPPGPPPEVLAEIDEAWGRAQRPLPEGLRLDFVSEPALGRAWGVLRGEAGATIERIPAWEAVAIACGDAVALPALAMSV